MHYIKNNGVLKNKDLNQFNEVMSEDFVWVKHSTGEYIGRDVLAKWFMSDDASKSENNRIIYENDQVSDYAETYNQCYIPTKQKLPPKPDIPYQEPKQIQEYLDKQKEGLEAPLSVEAK